MYRCSHFFLSKLSTMTSNALYSYIRSSESYISFSALHIRISFHIFHVMPFIFTYDNMKSLHTVRGERRTLKTAGIRAPCTRVRRYRRSGRPVPCADTDGRRADRFRRHARGHRRSHSRPGANRGQFAIQTDVAAPLSTGTWPEASTRGRFVHEGRAGLLFHPGSPRRPGVLSARGRPPPCVPSGQREGASRPTGG